MTGADLPPPEIPSGVLRMYRPRTGVVVLNYKSVQDTLACVDSLSLSGDLDLDLVVVDNAAENEETARLREAVGDRGQTIASGGNLGYAAGNNLAIDLLLDRGADLIWILNPDTVVAPDTLPRLKAHLDRVPDCGIVGPRLEFSDPPGKIWFDGGIVDRELGVTSHRNLGRSSKDVKEESRDVDYVTGASMLVRRALIEDIGAIPEHYFLYYEETDWCIRAQRAGWRTMVDGTATMVHHKRSSGTLPQPYYLYYMTRNRFLFAEDCLGIDGELALKHLDEKFLSPWRERVGVRAPELLAGFDEIVAMAKADGRSRVIGERPEVTDFEMQRA